MNGHPTDRLDAYLDGALTAPDMSQIRDHLAGCHSCRIELGRARSLREVLDVALRSAIPATRPVNVFAPSPRRRPIRVLVPVVAVAAGLLLAVLFLSRGESGIARTSNGFTLDAVAMHVPQAAGNPITIMKTGEVLVGNSPVSANMAEPVREALQARPSEIKPVVAPRGPISLRYPNPQDRAISTAPETLAWSGPASIGYVVFIEERTGAAWTPLADSPRHAVGYSVEAPPIKEGTVYRWRVARDQESSPWGYIYVLPERDRELLASARQEYGDDSVVVGSLCTSLGLLSSAERIFEYHAERHPEQRYLRDALNNVRNLMRGGT